MVLALSAVVIAGVVAYYQSASTNEKAEQTTAMVVSLISAVHSLYASQTNYDGMNEDTIAKSGMLPAQYVAPNPTDPKKMIIVTPNGDQVWSLPGAQGSGDEKKPGQTVWQLTYTIPYDLCPALARLNLGDSFVNLGIVEANSGGDPDHFYTKALSVSEAVSACSKAAGGDKGKVKLKYTLR
ncbi:hypothetical protein BL250_15010 [Erwinia sp. OLTSP20]|nr:hypothetical protein BK416_12910 [Erwinia sp. OLSSP12]PIJ85120.1 hypothetical protein BLD49_11635 [Erwinia sp. OLMDSP33]PIJ89836.1 hypothetical protein BL250_15010 [Erwinia sp. OLTSP20]